MEIKITKRTVETHSVPVSLYLTDLRTRGISVESLFLSTILNAWKQQDSFSSAAK